MTIHLRELSEGQRFVLCRTGEKYLYIGKRPSRFTGRLIHVCEREFGDKRQTSLHHSTYVKPIVRIAAELHHCGQDAEKDNRE